MPYPLETSMPSSSSVSSHMQSSHTHRGSISKSYTTSHVHAYHIGSPPHDSLYSLPSVRGYLNQAQADSTTSSDGHLELSAGMASLTSSTSQVLVASVVQRLVKRLPCNSGGRLSSLEEEELIRSSVANLVSHSEFQLAVVVKELLLLLESLNKQLSQATMEDTMALDIMHSQLFILQVLVACLIHSWKRPPPVEGLAGRNGDKNDLAKGWDDPPPLDDSLAKHILGVMTFYLRMTVVREEAVFNANMDPAAKLESAGSKAMLDRPRTIRREDAGDTELPSDGPAPTTLGLLDGVGLFVLYPNFPPSRSPFQLDARDDDGREDDLPRFNSDSTFSVISAPTSKTTKEATLSNVPLVMQSIYRQASQVLFFLSSSNWPVVHARYRNRITYMSTTSEESPNTSELHLLECSNLQRVRLASVIQELCTSFLHLKRNAQQTSALVLRRAIRAWIQYHPFEYAQLVASNRRLEGGSELLFDHVYGMADSSRKKVIYWPMMTSLLILCPDITSKIAVGDGRKSGSLGKKTNYLETLRKGLRSSKLSEVSALCCVDICSAATISMRGESGLRLVVPDLESDLKEKLFDPAKPLINATYNVIEVSLMVAAFVSFFRLDAQKTMKDLVPTLMSDSSPLAFKTALVRSCIQLASEKGRVPHHASVALLYPLVSSPLRAVFKELVYRLRSPEANNSTLPSKKAISKSKGVEEDEASRQELLQAILQLWHIDPQSAHFGMSLTHPTTLSSLAASNILFDEQALLRNALAVDSVMALIYVVTRAATTTGNWQIHNRANDLMQLYLAGRGIEEEFRRSARQAVVACAAHLTNRVAELLISSEGTLEQQHWLSMLQTIFLRKMALMKSSHEAASQLPNTSETSRARDMVEVALLLAICSADTDVCSLALQTCKLAARLRQLPGEMLPEGDEWTRLLIQLGDVDPVQTGRIAQQKRIRACLRQVSTCTGAIFAAWKEAYRRWRTLTQIVAKPLQDESNDAAQEKAAQWHNFAGFLSALGGACAVEQAPVLELELAHHSAIRRNVTTEESPLDSVANFVQEMVDLLVSDSIWVREKAKETLGSDLSPRLNGILFKMIHSVLSDFFDKVTGQAQPSDMYTIFVDHSVTVVQMVLAHMTPEATEATLNFDIGALMVLFAEYLNSLTKRDQAARVRTLMCLLCEQLMEKKSCFTLNDELRVRNRLFQVLKGWTTESIVETPSTEKTEKMDRLQRDLDVICLRTISTLLDKLPLFLAEDTPLLDDSVALAKSRHFSKCFTYFIKVLNRAKSIEEEATMERTLSASAPASNPVVAARSRENQSLRDLVPLKQSAIRALSNLLASNINTGLHHALRYAYEDDLQLRTAFMQIMTNVLNQGTAFDDLERLSASQKHSKLVDLVSEPDLQLALSICNVCRGYDVENMDYVLLNIFDSRGGVIRFLKAALSEEIEHTASEEMVFRSNSFRTHLLSLFGRTHGYEYLRSIIAPLITEMANKPKGYSFEIDSQRLGPGESALVNQHRLEEMAQAFIDQICNSAHRVPAVLRELCRHIRQLMDRKFPASRYQGVGGFIFLRFINPAIVAPQTIDINLSGPGRELRRGLLLISKVLQTLASNTLFPHHKEPFMTGLNDFLKQNVWKVTTFLDQVSDARTDPDRLLAADQPLGFGIHPFGYGIDQDDQAVLHKFFYDNIDKIGKELLNRPANGHENNSMSVLSASTVSQAGGRANDNSVFHAPGAEGRKVYDHLCITLSDLGDYRPEETNVVGQDGGSQALHEFMRRYSGRNVDKEEYRQIFRQGPPSKAGRPVFYYICWAQNAQTLDYESFIYYVLQLMQPCATQHYDVVFDCTGVQPNNLTPHQWLTYFVNLLPVEYGMNLRNVFGLNVNTACRLYTRPWVQTGETQSTGPSSAGFTAKTSAIQANMNLIFCSSITDLEAYIDRRNIALDSRTVSLLTSTEEIRFEQVTMVWYYRMLTPVTFKISEDHLQITALKPQAVFKGSSGLLNEVFHLADIDDVRAVSIRGDDNTFFVTCRGGTTSFLFISRDRSDIVQCLRQAKAKVSRFEGQASRTMERTLLPSDVPGTLLNMAMLNITSHDHWLRLGAYDLLCALSTSFNFGASNARKKLLSTKGLALSANTMSFVADLSRDFAVAAPGVTLEFLSSFFEGFKTATLSQKTACLQYMAPWLSNLAMFTRTSRDEQREYHKRIKEILSELIAMTVKEPEIYATMQRNVWSQIGKLDDLISIFLDVFAEEAMDSGLHTERFDSVLDTMVSFASINLRGKLLAKLRRVIAKTAQNSAVSQLHENAAWKEIATLVRMNMVLSFTSRMESLLYLPELLHVVLLLAGNGVDATRYSIHATAINLIHSLCTSDVPLRGDAKPQGSPPQPKGSASISGGAGILAENELTGGVIANVEGISKLRALLERLSMPESLALFGLPTDAVSAAASPFDASPVVVREAPGDQSIAQLASIMYQIVDMAAPSIDTSNAWRARLTSLVTSTAFQYNPIIQSRAFILLGCLADLTRSMLDSQLASDAPDAVTLIFEVDDDLLYQILVSLRGSIQEWASVANDSPIISIVTCLAKVVKILPDKSRYLAQMFWLGVSVIQYGHVPLFKSGVELMTSTIKSICQRNLPEKNSTDLLSYLLEGRFEFREEAIRLDDETGVDFESSFSFAMAALLVKGMRHPLTRDVTVELLQSLLRYSATDAQGNARSSSGRVSTMQLGFFVALLPTATKTEELAALLRMAGSEKDHIEHRWEHSSPAGTSAPSTRDGGIDNEAQIEGLYAHLEPLENKTALLVITLLASLLQHSTVSDPEKQQLYRFLADSARQFPAIVSILYDFLLPSIKEIYLNCQNDDILKSVDTITKVAISEPIFQLQFRETKKRGGAEAYLEESGYACLLDCGNFTSLKDSRRVALAKLSTALLSGLIDAGTA